MLFSHEPNARDIKTDTSVPSTLPFSLPFCIPLRSRRSIFSPSGTSPVKTLCFGSQANPRICLRGDQGI